MSIDRCSNSESWKAVKGWWDGISKDSSKKRMPRRDNRVDRDRWVTIRAIPLKGGTAMAADVAGVCVLTEILRSSFFFLEQMLVCSQCQSVY